MSTLILFLLAIGILGFGLVSGKVQKSIITLPIVFVAFGYLVGGSGLGLVELPMDDELIHLLAELTLVVVLFTDASRIDLKILRREHDLPVRLLSFGLPLTLILGTAVGAVLFPHLGIWEVALLAAILAPTDAALGQAVVSNPKVPVRIRQALNVESGLNDGIALPAVLVLLSIACATGQPDSFGYWIRFAALQVTLGPLVGVAVGVGGGKLLDWGTKSRWMSQSFLELGALGVALLAFSSAELVHGNGFIAAFCAGLAMGNSSRAICKVYEFAETEGQFMTLLVFLIFGGVLVPRAVAHADASMWLYAFLSLTLVRIVPVFLALIGKGLKFDTRLFLGWFGPRGIASILFALLVVEQAAGGQHEELVHIVNLTVLLSVLAHGISAYPGAAAYARRHKDGDHAEGADVTEMPLRLPERS